MQLPRKIIFVSAGVNGGLSVKLTHLISGAAAIFGRFVVCVARVAQLEKASRQEGVHILTTIQTYTLYAKEVRID